MKKIDEDIKSGSFAPIYLLYGEETYLMKQYKEKLIKALLPEQNAMNLSKFEGKGINPLEIIDLAETLPFFSDRRVVLMENSLFFKNKSDSLADYLKEMASTVCFIFIEDEIDKRGKMFKNAKATGRIVEFKRQNEKILTQWILSRLKRENKKITQAVMQQFFTAVGMDMWNINHELEKLLCYTVGKEVIELADIDAICVPQITNKIFDMVNAIGEKNQEMALQLYYDLRALKEPPMRILFLIVRQFRIILQVKELNQKGYDNKYIASKVSIPEFVVRKQIGQARYFTKEQLLLALEDCARTEEDVKTGNINDQISVELLIVKYSKKEKQVNRMLF